MKIKVTTTTEQEIDVTFPMYVKYNGLCKITSETDCIEVNNLAITTMSEHSIEIRHGYPNLVTMLVQDGKPISEQEFNAAFETALREINSMADQNVNA